MKRCLSVRACSVRCECYIAKESARSSKLTVFRDLDPEGQLVSDANSLDLPGPHIQDADPRLRGLWRAGDADHFRVPDRHHPKADVLRGHVVGALHLVYLIGLRHHHGMVLEDDCVRVDATLETVALSR